MYKLIISHERTEARGFLLDPALLTTADSGCRLSIEPFRTGDSQSSGQRPASGRPPLAFLHPQTESHLLWSRIRSGALPLQGTHTLSDLYAINCDFTQVFNYSKKTSMS